MSYYNPWPRWPLQLAALVIVSAGAKMVADHIWPTNDTKTNYARQTAPNSSTTPVRKNFPPSPIITLDGEPSGAWIFAGTDLETHLRNGSQTKQLIAQAIAQHKDLGTALEQFNNQTKRWIVIQPFTVNNQKEPYQETDGITVSVNDGNRSMIFAVLIDPQNGTTDITVLRKPDLENNTVQESIARVKSTTLESTELRQAIMQAWKPQSVIIQTGQGGTLLSNAGMNSRETFQAVGDWLLTKTELWAATQAEKNVVQRLIAVPEGGFLANVLALNDDTSPRQSMITMSQFWVYKDNTGTEEAPAIIGIAAKICTAQDNTTIAYWIDPKSNQVNIDLLDSLPKEKPCNQNTGEEENNDLVERLNKSISLKHHLFQAMNR